MNRVDRLSGSFRRFSGAVAAVQARIILGVVYIVVVVPFAVILRIVGAVKSPQKGWIPWSMRADTLEEVRKQY